MLKFNSQTNIITFLEKKKLDYPLFNPNKNESKYVFFMNKKGFLPRNRNSQKRREEKGKVVKKPHGLILLLEHSTP